MRPFSSSILKELPDIWCAEQLSETQEAPIAENKASGEDCERIAARN